MGDVRKAIEGDREAFARLYERYGRAVFLDLAAKLDVEEAKLRLEQGFRCIAYNGDLWLYQQALRAGLRGIRQALP